MPPLLRWEGDWDTWRHVRLGTTEEAWAFSTAMFDANHKLPGELLWWRAMLQEESSNAVERIIRDTIVARGEELLKPEKRRNRSLLGSRGFEATLVTPDKEYRVVAVNANGGSLMFLDYYKPEEHDAMLKFYFVDPDTISVGIYSDGPHKVHCGDLCRALGHAGPTPSGGGHAGVGGFQTDYAYFRTLLKDFVPLYKK